MIIDDLKTNCAARFVFVDVNENYILHTSDLAEIFNRVAPADGNNCLQPLAQIELNGKSYLVEKIMLDYYKEIVQNSEYYEYHEGLLNPYNIDLYIVVRLL